MKVCVHCGVEVVDRHRRPVTELYDTQLYAKSRILRLRECRACSRTVDPYLEQEGTLVLLDIALQSQPVLRHVLVNSDHNVIVLKMVLLTIIVDGYCRLVAYVPVPVTVLAPYRRNLMYRYLTEIRLFAEIDSKS